jgi:hypothetical protein
MSDLNELLLPPTPPSNEDFASFIPGAFDYIKSSDDSYKRMLVNAYQAITQTETWNFVKEDCKSFAFSNDPRVSLIIQKMEELGYYGHSGGSFGFIMRDMQYIAKNGEEKFRVEYFKSN